MKATPLTKKLRKLLRNPGAFFNDALRNRINQLIQERQPAPKAATQPMPKTASTAAAVNVTPLPKMSEHLVAMSLIRADQAPEGTPNERVYILTGVPFWRGRLGNQVRIRELANYIRQHYSLTVIYTGLLTTYDAKEIASKGWSNNIRTLVHTSTAYQYEQTLKDASVQNQQAYAGSLLTKAYLSDYPCRAIIVEYITHEPYVRDLDADCLRIIDTHDIMSVRMQAFAAHGRDHHIKMSEAEEIHWLNTFDKVIAIQSDEYAYLSARMDPSKLILSHHAVPTRPCLKKREPRRLIYMAGKNPANLDSIEWFFKRVLPLLRDKRLEIHLYGAICDLISKSIVTAYKDRLHLHGEIDDQYEAYSAGDIVINPVLYGGGLKIKTVEAMAHGMPMVTTDEGARGLLNLAGRCFLVANSPEEFARCIATLCSDERLRASLSAEALLYTEENFSPDKCFGVIIAAIAAHREHLRVARGSRDVDSCPDNHDRTLVLGRRDFPFFAGAYDALAKYCNAIYMPASDIASLNQFKQILATNCIDRVLINNPYISEKVLAFYRYALASGISVTTFDRGALPDSWFFDNRGFNGDSESYAPALWDKPISDARRKRFEAYIEQLAEDGRTLEKQGARVGKEALRERLRIGKRKVLFIPFQRPNDTVVKYFGGKTKGMDGFCQLVNEVCSGLNKKEWAIIGKRHPLEATDPLTLAQMAPSDTHVQDLLELADTVLVLNSGVGLLSLLARKPTFVSGEAFYSHDGLAKRIDTASELLAHLEQPTVPDREKVARFTSYLLEDFYSFGKAGGYLREEAGGELSSITTRIAFCRIRGIAPMAHETEADALLCDEPLPPFSLASGAIQEIMSAGPVPANTEQAMEEQ
jgi:glycosyltransferase involved in cell wall biosynthesis